MRPTSLVLEAEGVALATRPSSVVLAEGDSTTRHLLASALRKSGYEVIVARDSDELVEHLGSLCLQHEFPDLIICDARMPGGLRILASLRETDWTPTPVIVITASGSPRFEVDSHLESCVAVFEMPVDMDDLQATVRNILGPVEA